MRVSVSTVVGIVAGVLVGLSMGWIFAAPIGFDVAALIFVTWTWAAVRRMDAAQTTSHATREDPSRRLTRLIVLAACVASLGGVGVLLVRARELLQLLRADAGDGDQDVNRDHDDERAHAP